MTEYELVDTAISYQDLATTHFMNFVTILFAYLVCAYLVGEKLTRLQVWLLNSLYTIFALGAAFASYAAYNRSFLQIQRLAEVAKQEAPQLAPAPTPEFATIIMAFMLVSYGVGLVFLQSRRRGGIISLRAGGPPESDRD